MIVRDCVMSQSLCLVISIGLILSSLEYIYSSDGVVIDSFYERLKFDESQMKLSVDCHKWLSRDQRISSWAVLCQMRLLTWVINGQVFMFPVPCLPAIVVGTHNAGAVYNAI